MTDTPLKPCPELVFSTHESEKVINKLIEALKFYADPETYVPKGFASDFVQAAIKDDEGKLARDVLTEAGAL